MKILVVGERMNMPSFRPQCWPDVTCERYWKYMRRLGAFQDARSQVKLKSIGVDLGDGDVSTINLLPPDSPGVPWDASIAKAVAVSWQPRLAEFDLIMLCGIKVTRAFNIDMLGTLAECCGTPVDLDGVNATILPHPSGLNLWWNDKKNVTSLRRRLKSLMRRIPCQG
jgi:hypothetical protein